MSDDFNKQFSLKSEYYLNQLDFLNWFRYYYLVKDVLRLKSVNLMEVGAGGGLVRNCLEPLVSSYTTLDVNKELNPDILSDIRDTNQGIVDQFDCAIAADVLEHIPFSDLKIAVSNMFKYINPGGYALITIPHRQSNFLFMTPAQIPHVVTVPTGFLSLGGFYRRFIKRKIWIDPNHCWEIGDGNIKKKDVDNCFLDVGFKIIKFQKLLYVDYWVLQKVN